jgi:hypothetical protein
MTTVLRTIQGNYDIVSMKRDNCSYRHFDILYFVTWVTIIVAVVAGFLLAAKENSALPLVIWIADFIYMLIADYILYEMRGCGVRLELTHHPSRSGIYFASREYMFSDNIEEDAKNIELLAKGLENYALQMEEDKKKDSERMKEKELQSKQCCDRYKTIMEKVK